MNYTDTCTITRRNITTVDAETGVPTLGAVPLLTKQRCAFAVINALQHAQAWGSDETPTQTQAAHAHLILPSWATPLPLPLDRLAVVVTGYAGVWRITASRPGEQWTIFLVSQP